MPAIVRPEPARDQITLLLARKDDLEAIPGSVRDHFQYQRNTFWVKGTDNPVIPFWKDHAWRKIYLYCLDRASYRVSNPD